METVACSIVYGIVFMLILSANVVGTSSSSHSFAIDYANNTFLLDGRPFRYISGSIHYFRMPAEYWLDRLMRIRAAGLNAIQVYVAWNFHERNPGRYTFDGMANITQFISLAHQVGLYVLLRPGPYICAEFENGGLPWWLLKMKTIRLRSSDPQYLEAIDRWFAILLPKLTPYLYKNGGPILMVQVENEYGSFFDCDRNYTVWLRDRFRQYFGDDIVLYTSRFWHNYDSAAALADPMLWMNCGVVPGVYPTVDFGPNSNAQVDKAFARQREYSPQGGPLVNSEFYSGWLIVWGQTDNFNIPSTSALMNTSRYMFSLGASFNFYMFYGGTNFGYWNGAEYLSPLLTSYDYCAPIAEDGSTTANYRAIRDWIGTIPNWTHPPGEILPDPPKAGYGMVKLENIGSVLEMLDLIADQPIVSRYPLTFEDLNHPYGFVLYQTILQRGGSGNLTAANLKDRGYVMVDDVYQGTIIHIFGLSTQHTIGIQTRIGSKLSILVENRGRQTFETINDMKGINGDVILDGQILSGWTHWLINIDDAFFARLEQPDTKRMIRLKSSTPLPSIYIGQFVVSQPSADTFLDPTGWGKGQAFVNGFNIGRYWSIGPQVTLYTPKTALKSYNTLVLFELEHAGNCDQIQDQCSINFIDHPIINVPL